MTLTGGLKGLLRTVLAARGYELKQVGAPPRGFANLIAALQQQGVRPRTVIDIGVAQGTPWLHGAFPGAHLVLIEPNARFAPILNRLAAEYGATIYDVALGASDGTLVLREDQARPSSSSALRVNRGVPAESDRRYIDIRVPIRTLDSIASPYAGPCLIKIDTEGYECEVLRGATETLARTDVLIVEASVAPRFEGGYEFAELVALLDARGFRLYDVAKIKTLGPGGPINYIDAVFASRDWITSTDPAGRYARSRDTRRT